MKSIPNQRCKSCARCELRGDLKMSSWRGRLHCATRPPSRIVPHSPDAGDRHNANLRSCCQKCARRGTGIRRTCTSSRILRKDEVMKSGKQTGKVCLLIGAVVVGLASGVWAQSANVSVFATGFNNPRGLKFGPDGYLYVAEGGAGGAMSTVGLCEQAVGLPTGPGPYTGG